MPFDALNPAAVAELAHAVHGMDKTSNHVTSSPPFAVKCDNGPTARY
jgi:hypothetical protein